MDNQYNLLNRKVLLRIPSKLAIKVENRQGGPRNTKINSKISQAVEKFHSEVVPEPFKKAFIQGLSKRELMFWPRQARQAGFFPSVESPTKKRKCFGTVLSIKTLDLLKVIAMWGGTSRQSAVDASIAYYFQIPGAPNPDRGQFSRFTYPMVSGTDRLTQHRLRWLVEYGNI